MQSPSTDAATLVKPQHMTEDEFLYGRISGNPGGIPLTKTISSPGVLLEHASEDCISKGVQVSSNSDTCVNSSQEIESSKNARPMIVPTKVFIKSQVRSLFNFS